MSLSVHINIDPTLKLNSGQQKRSDLLSEEGSQHSQDHGTVLATIERHTDPR